MVLKAILVREWLAMAVMQAAMAPPNGRDTRQPSWSQEA